MSSPRKQRKLDDGTPTTPQKTEENTPTKIVFTPIQSFDWAEVSATEYEQKTSSKVDIEVNVDLDVEEDSEFPSLALSHELSSQKCDSGGPANRTRSRKKPTPKRLETANKFDKNLDLSAALKFARSERVKRLEADKRRNEQGLTPNRQSTSSFANPVEDGQRKRRRSPSVSTIASSVVTPGRRIQQKKVQRLDDNTSQTSTPSRSSKSMTPNDTMSPRPLDHYAVPKTGWCEDEAVLKRRTSEVEKAKALQVYQRYNDEVPRTARIQSDPRTPNKYLKHSRRGWDGQLRSWKKSLYTWAGEEYVPSEAGSRSTSRSTSRAESREGDDKVFDFENNNAMNDRKEGKLKPEKLQFGGSALENPDNVASLLGHFDFNTRQGTLMNDESTLKANENRVGGATDFSQLHQS